MKIFFLKVFNFTINNIKIVRYLLPCVLPYIYNLKNKNFYQNITFDILLKKKKVTLYLFVEPVHQLMKLKIGFGKRWKVSMLLVLEIFQNKLK